MNQATTIVGILLTGIILGGCAGPTKAGGESPTSGATTAPLTPTQATTPAPAGTSPVPSGGFFFQANGSLPPTFNRVLNIPVNATEEKIEAVLSLNRTATGASHPTRTIGGVLIDPGGDIHAEGRASGTTSVTLIAANPAAGTWKILYNGTQDGPDLGIPPQPWRVSVRVT